jgi:hypothetical protein
VRRKKNRVYPSPEAVSRAPDSRERLRKYSLQSDTERAPLTRGLVIRERAIGLGSWSCAAGRPRADAAPAGIRTIRDTHIREGVRVARLYAHAGHAPLTSHL